MKTDKLLLTAACLLFAYAVLGNYVALPGYLRFLERGGTSAAGNTMDIAVIIGATKTILWMYAFNLGALCLYWLTLRSIAPNRVKTGMVISIIWLCFWSIPELPRMPALFYILFGGMILIAIIAAQAWTTNPLTANRNFFLATSILFFAIATWDVCGLGSVGRILHPEQVILDRSQLLLSTQTTKLMIAMLIAWSCLALSAPIRIRQKNYG